MKVIEFADQNCTIRSGMNRSKLVETLHPLAELAFVDTPLGDPTLKADSSFRLTIPITVRLDTRSNSAVSLRVSKRIGSSRFSIGVGIVPFHELLGQA